MLLKPPIRAMVLFVELVLVLLTIMSFLSPQGVWAIKGKCWGHLGVGGDSTGKSVSLCPVYGNSLHLQTNPRHPVTSIVDLTTGLRPDLLWAYIQSPLSPSSFLRSPPSRASPPHRRAPWLLYHFLAATCSSCPPLLHGPPLCLPVTSSSSPAWHHDGLTTIPHIPSEVQSSERASRNVAPDTQETALCHGVRSIHQHSQMQVGT